MSEQPTRPRRAAAGADPATIARMRSLVSSGARLGEDGFEAVVASLTARQREVFALMVEAIVERGKAPDPHEIATKLSVHYTSAKRTMDRISRIIPELVVSYHHIRNASGNNS